MTGRPRRKSALAWLVLSALAAGFGFSPGDSYGQSCNTPSFQSCADVAAYRQKAVAGNLYLEDPCLAYGSREFRAGEYRIGLNVACLTAEQARALETACHSLQESNSFLKALSPEEALQRQVGQSVTYAAWQAAKTGEGRVLADARALNLFIAENKDAIPETMSPDDLKQAVRDLSQHFINASQTLAKQPKAPSAVVASLGGYVPHQIMAEMGLETFTASQKANWHLDDVSPARRAVFDALMSSSTESPERFHQLVAAMTDFARAPTYLASPFAPSVSRKELEGQLSPYYARMILLFYAARKIREKDPANAERKLDALVGAMQSKINVTEGTSPDVHFANMAFHDGYVYGATREMGDAFESRHALRPEQSAAVDCSLFVGLALYHAGYRGERITSGRTNTVEMMQAGWQRSIMDHHAICSEKDLRPGDPIVMNDHTVLFVGYQPKPPYRMLVMEASGKSFRRIQLAPFDVYGEESGEGGLSSSVPGSCSTSIFSGAAARGHAMQRLRLKPDEQKYVTENAE